MAGREAKENMYHTNFTEKSEKFTVKRLAESGIFQVLCLGGDQEAEAGEREIESPFCCDLLSLAMSRAPQGCAWVTVMGNINTLAVASLTEAACVILAEGISLDEISLKKAEEQGIAVFRTEKPVFEAAMEVYQLLRSCCLEDCSGNGVNN